MPAAYKGKKGHFVDIPPFSMGDNLSDLLFAFLHMKSKMKDIAPKGLAYLQQVGIECLYLKETNFR